MASCPLAPLHIRTALAALGVAVMATVLVFPPATSVAEPRRSLKDAKAQVATLQHKAEMAAEEYNTARVEREEVRQRLRTLTARVRDKRGDVSDLHTDLGGMASATYRSGGVGHEILLLLADNPQDFLRAASALQEVTKRQSSMLRHAHSAEHSLAADQHQLVRQQARRAEISRTLADRKAEVEKRLAKAKDVYDSLEAKQRARLEAQRKEAARKAREARQERASRSSSRTGSGTTSGSGSGSVTTDAAAQKAVDFAYAQLGEPYVWGAAGPDSWDCSGLTMMAWNAAGVSLPHSSSMQYSEGRKVSRSELRPGDLVFYYSPISHVAIYVGNGKIIHAPNSSEPVQTAPVDLMPYAGATRP